MSLRKIAVILVFGASLAIHQSGKAAELGYRTFAKAGTYADVSENLKDAIIKRGYVIDYVGQFNTMLQRTAQDTGTVSQAGNTSPYRNAEFVQFCPSRLTHEAVNASPLAIASCPIAFFLYELAYEHGKIHIGYRLPVPSASKRVSEVNDKIMVLMQQIAEEALK